MHANAISIIVRSEKECTNVRVQREYARSLILDEKKGDPAERGVFAPL